MKLLDKRNLVIEKFCNLVIENGTANPGGLKLQNYPITQLQNHFGWRVLQNLSTAILRDSLPVDNLPYLS